LENKDFTHGQNITINSQTYVVTNTTTADGSAGGFKVESADAYANTHRDVFPYLQLIAGEEYPRLAFVNTTNLINDDAGDTIDATGIIYNLPTGTVNFSLQSDYLQYSVDSATAVNLSVPDGGLTNITVGEVVYQFTNVTNKITAVKVIDGTAASELKYPALMFVEDEDKADSNSKHVILATTTDGTYSQLSSFVFSGSTDSQTWDNTKYTGYLTTYGTYALKDTTDTNVALGSLSYGRDQMYANVYLAEASASITTGGTGGTGTLGDVLVKDTEVGNVATKNLIVVGGSCINSAAAALVGGTKCGASWTTATGVGSGQFIIKGYATSSITSKLALLVAGYEAADTANAATYLRTKAVDTSKAYKGTSATSAELIVE
jgi:hypothetical protein